MGIIEDLRQRKKGWVNMKAEKYRLSKLMHKKEKLLRQLKGSCYHSILHSSESYSQCNNKGNRNMSNNIGMAKTVAIICT